MMWYDFISVTFTNVDDMPKGRDDVDVDASEWSDFYPSGEMVFWNDISVDIRLYLRIKIIQLM